MLSLTAMVWQFRKPPLSLGSKPIEFDVFNPVDFNGFRLRHMLYICQKRA